MSEGWGADINDWVYTVDEQNVAFDPSIATFKVPMSYYSKRKERQISEVVIVHFDLNNKTFDFNRENRIKVAIKGMENALTAYFDKHGETLALKILANANKNSVFNQPTLPQQAGKPRKGTYESMTVQELKERCKKRKIKYAGLKKADLIAKLRHA